VITPRDFALSVLDPSLHGVSLEQACRDGKVDPQTVREILAREFLCEMENKLVRPPDIAKVFLEGEGRADQSNDQSG
jgi:hypothetical protein